MKYQSNRELCVTCQFWEGERKKEPFTIDTNQALGRCVADFKNGPKKSAQTPACSKYKKWDKI